MENKTFSWMNMSFVSQYEVMDFKIELYRYAIPAMTVVCAVAMIFNIIVLWSSRWTHKPFTPTLVLTMSLAMADLSASLVVAVSLFCNSYMALVHRFIFEYFMCMVTTMEAIRLGSVVTSVFHLAAISCTHYIAAAHGLRYHGSSSHWHIFIVIFLMWTIPPLGFLAGFAMFPEHGYNSPNCTRFEIFHTSRYRVPVVLIVILPLILMCLLYWRIIMLLKQRLRVAVDRNALGRLLAGPSSQNTSVSIIPRTMQQYRRVGRRPAPMTRQATESPRKLSLLSAKQAMRMSYTALILIGSFLVTMLPACIVYLLTCSDCTYPAGRIRDDLYKSKVLASISILSNSLIIIKCAVNPFLYAFRIPEIKKALRAMFRSGCKIKQHSCIVQRLHPFTITPATRRKSFEVSFHSQNGQERMEATINGSPDSEDFITYNYRNNNDTRSPSEDADGIESLYDPTETIL